MNSFPPPTSYVYLVLAHCVKKWDLAAKRPVLTFSPAHTCSRRRMQDCAPTPCGRYLYVSFGRDVVRYNAQTGQPLTGVAVEGVNSVFVA